MHNKLNEEDECDEQNSRITTKRRTSFLLLVWLKRSGQGEGKEGVVVEGIFRSSLVLIRVRKLNS